LFALANTAASASPSDGALIVGIPSASRRSIDCWIISSVIFTNLPEYFFISSMSFFSFASVYFCSAIFFASFRFFISSCFNSGGIPSKM